MLLYSAPILLIAVLAVPYLLLSGGQDDVPAEYVLLLLLWIDCSSGLSESNINCLKCRKKSPGLRLGTFPVLVDGVFGVVTAAEFIGIATFVAFVLWAVYWYTVVNFEILPSYGDITSFEKRYVCVFAAFAILM